MREEMNMAFESDVNRQANILNDATRNARNERNRVKSIVDNASQWWKGKGGETFINEFRNADNEADHFLRNIDNAVSNLNRLPSLIQRAERERRERAERG